MPTNFAQFDQQVREVGQRLAPEQVSVLHRKIAIEALTRLVLKTPVDTGRARGNWQLNTSRPSESVDTEKKDRSGGSTIEEGVGNLSLLKPFDIVFISNNLDYIEFLEEGSSRQAPEGMLAVTVAELQEIFQ